MDVIYTDDARMIGELIKENWSLGPGSEPPIVYDTESLMVNSRTGNIFVSSSTRDYSISSVDYQTVNRSAHVSIRVSNRFREIHYQWAEEVYRILMDVRRSGARKLGGYTYLEVQSDRSNQDANAWYVKTFDVRLTGYFTPIGPSGFGTPEIPKHFHADEVY